MNRDIVATNWKIKIVLVTNEFWNQSYSIEWIQNKHYWISITRMSDILQYFWKERIINLLEEHQDFKKIQEIYDTELSETVWLDLWQFEMNNDFEWVLTKEMLEIFDFLEPFSKNYYISWWTAISLHLRHRESVDFDTFSNWNNLNLYELRKHILNYKKYKVTWRIKDWNWKRYIEINKENILDLVNNNQEIHLKINWVTIDISDYSRRLTDDQWSYLSVWYHINWFPIKVPDLLTLWWSKIWAMSTRLKNKDIEDLRYIMKETWYSIKDLLDSFINTFWNNLIIYWYLDILKTESIRNEKYEPITWINWNTWLNDNDLLELWKEYCREVLRIVENDIWKYLRERDLEKDNELFKNTFEEDFKWMEEYFMWIVEKHKEYKEKNSFKNKFLNFFKRKK